MAWSAEQLRRIFGAQHPCRMRVEGDDDGGAAVLFGMLLRGPDDLLVAEVKTVENTDGERKGPWKGGEGVDGAEDLHLG